MSWTKTLLLWFEDHRRDFPWRKTKDPYSIWLSEIIMQQTRVEQGTPYYLKFIEKYPTVQDLASSKEEEVLKLWQGLGYYSRARNLLASAQWVVSENEGVFPNTHRELLQLKGVGDYTASAISSICFSEAQAVVDGNVYRFLSRCFGMDTPINHSSAPALFKKKAQLLMGKASPGEFNQAMMEFGALHCTPKSPQCSTCPFQAECVAHQQGKVCDFPVKTKRVKIRKRFFNYLILQTPSKRSVMMQRKEKGIWQNLFEFPLIETQNTVEQNELMNHSDFQAWQATQFSQPLLLTPRPIKHVLSHQHLYIQFWEIKSSEEWEEATSFKRLKKHPMPIVLAHFIENFEME